MAETVISPNEIYLSSTRFPIKGRVSPALISTLPGKVTIGDYSLVDDQLASNWVISDQRGGLLVEEMVEAIHQDRYWWGDCDCRFKGHIVLPPLVTQVLPTYLILRPSAAGNETSINTQYPDETSHYDKVDESYQDDATTYVSNVGATNDGGGLTYETDLYDIPAHWGVGTISKIKVCFRARNISCTGGKAKATIRTHSTNYSGTEQDMGADGTWVDLTQEWTTNPNTSAAWTWAEITALEIGISLKAGDFAAGDAAQCTQVYVEVYADDIGLIDESVSAMCNYNSLLYVAMGNVLVKLNTAGNAWTFVRAFEADITALIASEGNHLYILIGDSNSYWYMDSATPSVFTEAVGSDGAGGGSSAATKGVHWDNKLFKMDSAGAMTYSTDPSSATPTWTVTGDLADEGLADNDVNNLFVYRDADGDPIIYAATKVGLFAHDFTNGKWIETELALPNHPTGGKGAEVWHNGSFISAGLSVKKYIAARTATIADAGLDQDDGLPAKYRGEIVKLIKGYNEFYALVDSSLVTGEGYSSVMARNALGWQCKWQATTADDTMHEGIVSSATAYRLWFDHNDKIYYITLQRDIQNPLQIATYAYGTSGTHFTPWFDGAWAGGKTALTLKVKCKGMSATEDITVSYRIDHATTGIDATWTALGSAIEADGETELFFPNSTTKAGTEFKAIQFKFALARTNATPATDKLKTPDLQYAKLKYLKNLDTKWGWTTVIDCSQEYKGNTPSQLVSALETIISTKTLMEFTYRNESGGSETHKCRVANCQGLTQSGEDWRSSYQISLVAP